MKKSILFAALLCLGNLAVAENLQFVTTLSSPLGTFAQLETADPTVMAKSPVVNFCNTRVSAGTITLNGANSYLQKLNLKASTTLGGNIKEYRIGTGLTVNADSNITGGRLMGSNVTFDGSVDAKSDVTGTLYLSNAATVQGAKTTTLTIPGQVEVTTAGGGDSLEWSNAYNCDYKETEGSDNQTGKEEMVRYNPNNGLFEAPSGLRTSDTCNGNALVKYTGTPSSECIDVWLEGSTSNMLSNNLGTITVTESGEGCTWPIPCGSYYKVVPVCNARLPSGYRITDGSDISFALSSRNNSITDDQRWKHYVPKKDQVNQFFGALKDTYERWLNNGDWELQHPYTFNVCIQDAKASSKGVRYTLSYGTTAFKAIKRFPENSGGNADCANEDRYTSFLLKSK